MFVYSDNQEGISRAYENIGRVYARSGKFKEALDIWNKKLPLVESEMEKAWLYHEIGIDINLKSFSF